MLSGIQGLTDIAGNKDGENKDYTPVMCDSVNSVMYMFFRSPPLPFYHIPTDI